ARSAGRPHDARRRRAPRHRAAGGSARSSRVTMSTQSLAPGRQPGIRAGGSERSRHHVCFVLPSLNGGGAERAAVQVLNALNPGTWDRSMYLFERTGPYLSDVAPGVSLDSGAAGASRFARWVALRRYVRERRPELIVSFLSYFSVLSAARAAATGVRVVFN